MIAMLKACKAVGNVLMVSKGPCVHQPGHLGTMATTMLKLLDSNTILKILNIYFLLEETASIGKSVVVSCCFCLHLCLSGGMSSEDAIECSLPNDLKPFFIQVPSFVIC